MENKINAVDHDGLVALYNAILVRASELFSPRQIAAMFMLPTITVSSDIRTAKKNPEARKGMHLKTLKEKLFRFSNFIRLAKNEIIASVPGEERATFAFVEEMSGTLSEIDFSDVKWSQEQIDSDVAKQKKILDGESNVYENIALRMPLEIDRKLKEESEKTGRSISDIVGESIVAGLENEDVKKEIFSTYRAGRRDTKNTKKIEKVVFRHICLERYASERLKTLVQPGRRNHFVSGMLKKRYAIKESGEAKRNPVLTVPRMSQTDFRIMTKSKNSGSVNISIRIPAPMKTKLASIARDLHGKRFASSLLWSEVVREYFIHNDPTVSPGDFYEPFPGVEESRLWVVKLPSAIKDFLFDKAFDLRVSVSFLSVKMFLWWLSEYDSTWQYPDQKK